jgi:hypothetical protein
MGSGWTLRNVRHLTRSFFCSQRLDMASGDIANILSRLSSRPYITQEVVWGAGEAVQPSEYIGKGVVQSFFF